MSMSCSIGDVFGMPTRLGVALVQVVKYGHTKTNLDIVRVLDGFVPDNDPDQILAITQKKELFFLHMPMLAASRKKLASLFIVMGNYEVPSTCVVPVMFRTDSSTRGNPPRWAIAVERDGVLSWQEVGKLNKQFYNLSPWGMWSIPVLVERLENGWRLDTWK